MEWGNPKSETKGRILKFLVDENGNSSMHELDEWESRALSGSLVVVCA